MLLTGPSLALLSNALAPSSKVCPFVSPPAYSGRLLAQHTITFTVCYGQADAVAALLSLDPMARAAQLQSARQRNCTQCASQWPPVSQSSI